MKEKLKPSGESLNSITSGNMRKNHHMHKGRTYLNPLTGKMEFSSDREKSIHLQEIERERQINEIERLLDF